MASVELDNAEKSAPASATAEEDRPPMSFWLAAIQTGAMVVQTVAIVLGLIYAGAQLTEIKTQTIQGKDIAAATLSIELDKTLGDKTNSTLIDALDNEPSAKIFKPHGKFTEREVIQLLGWYETIGDLYRKNLITCDLIYGEFSYDLVKAYNNSDIKDYVIASQKLDPDTWTEFQRMGKLFSVSPKKPCPE